MFLGQLFVIFAMLTQAVTPKTYSHCPPRWSRGWCRTPAWPPSTPGTATGPRSCVRWMPRWIGTLRRWNWCSKCRELTWTQGTAGGGHSSSRQCKSSTVQCLQWSALELTMFQTLVHLFSQPWIVQTKFPCHCLYLRKFFLPPHTIDNFWTLHCRVILKAPLVMLKLLPSIFLFHFIQYFIFFFVIHQGPPLGWKIGKIVGMLISIAKEVVWCTEYNAKTPRSVQSTIFEKIKKNWPITLIKKKYFDHFWPFWAVFCFYFVRNSILHRAAFFPPCIQCIKTLFLS